MMNELESKARTFAEKAHGDQTRWDGFTPYISHPDRVVELLKHWRVTDSDIIVAAYLHDVVEDTKITLDDIQNNFGLNVRAIVSELTFPLNIEDYHYYERCESMYKDYAIIKIADIISNITEIGDGSMGISKHFLTKRLKAIKILADKI